MNTLSTFPFKAKFYGAKVDSLSKGKIVVEDDVWIGTDALILSGTHIGKGAVIDARVVVSGKIPAYAIVVGNSGKIINKLENVDFNKINERLLKDNVDLLYKPLTKDNLRIILTKLKYNLRKIKNMRMSIKE